MALGNWNLNLSLGRLLAYTEGGSYDTTFGNGTAVVDLDLEEGTRIDAVAIQSDGRVALAGTIDANGTQTGGFFLARTLANGALDPSFDGNGVQRVKFDRTVDAADRVAAATLSGGRLVAVGTATGAAPVNAFAVLRVQSALVFADDLERGTTGAWAGD